MSPARPAMGTQRLLRNIYPLRTVERGLYVLLSLPLRYLTLGAPVSYEEREAATLLQRNLILLCESFYPLLRIAGHPEAEVRTWISSAQLEIEGQSTRSYIRVRYVQQPSRHYLNILTPSIPVARNIRYKDQGLRRPGRRRSVERTTVI